MLLLWTLVGALIAVASGFFAITLFIKGNLLIGFAFAVLALVAAVFAITAYYARERITTIRELFGW